MAGLAYGSNTSLAHNLLLEAARENPRVLSDPAPLALFRGFGDNSLDFELRVYIASVDYLLSISHDLHMTIDQKFRNAHIEIAFPQRDLHLRSVETPLQIRFDRQDHRSEIRPR